MFFYKKKTRKELNEEFNRYLKNKKVLLYLKLRGYLNNDEIEHLIILIGFLKNYIDYSSNHEFINFYNLYKYIMSSKEENMCASEEEIEEYFNIFELNTETYSFEKKLIKLLEYISVEPMIFIKKYLTN